MKEHAGEHVRVLISEEDIRARVKEVAAQISRDYEGRPIHLICILKGGAMFMCELAKGIDNPDVTLDFMSVSSYGTGTTSSGIVKIVKDLDEPLEGKNVLIVEDIVTTGGSVVEVLNVVKEHGGVPVGVGLLVDRSGGKVDFGLRTEALLHLNVETFKAENCPLCAKEVPFTKRGRSGK